MLKEVFNIYIRSKLNTKGRISEERGMKME